MATGGGPEAAVAEVDLAISAITPHLMENAPIVFSSNTPIAIYKGLEFFIFFNS